MKIKLLFTFLFSIGYFTINSQIVSGKIINKKTLKPIDKVAIITDLNKGSTSDKDGNYKIQIKNISSATFSSLGFETLTLTLVELKRMNYKVALTEKVNELDEIQLNLTKYSLDSILIKSQKSMNENYISGTLNYQFYARENTKIDFKKLELELEKSTLLNKISRKLAEQEFTDYANNLKTSNPDVSTEFFGTIQPQKVYSKKLKKHYNKNKVDSVAGYSLLKNNKQITIKDAQVGLQNIVLKHLDRNKTYKISTGLFKIEDSLSMKEILKEADSLDVDTKFNNYQPLYLFNDAIYKGKFYAFKKQKNFYDKKYYKHSLEKNELLGSKLLYVVKFSPRKSKSKFSGKMYIDPKDFSIVKLEYQFADGKRGQNINLKWLLGIKVSEDINKVTLYYEKNTDNKVYLTYYKESRGTYAYVHRPIKFKENSPSKNKVKFDIKIELDTRESTEVLFSSVTSIEKSKIKTGTEKINNRKKQAYLTLVDYQKTNWQNRKLIIDFLKKYE